MLAIEYHWWRHVNVETRLGYDCGCALCIKLSFYHTERVIGDPCILVYLMLTNKMESAKVNNKIKRRSLHVMWMLQCKPVRRMSSLFRDYVCQYLHFILYWLILIRFYSVLLVIGWRLFSSCSCTKYCTNQAAALFGAAKNPFIYISKQFVFKHHGNIQ